LADFIWREKVGSAAHKFFHLRKKTHFSCSRHHQQALSAGASEYELETLEQITSWISITRSSSSLVRLDNSTSCQVSAVLQPNVCLNFSFIIVVCCLYYTALPTRSLNYFLICLAFFIFCPLFYILCRFVKLLCFPGSVPADATALSATESDENSDIGVYVIDIDLIQGYIRNSETSSDRQNHYCFASATPHQSRRLSPSQIPKTCPSYGELYDLDSRKCFT
jgi:hypothetical protein